MKHGETVELEWRITWMRCTANMPQLTKYNATFGMNRIHHLPPRINLFFRINSRYMRKPVHNHTQSFTPHYMESLKCPTLITNHILIQWERRSHWEYTWPLTVWQGFFKECFSDKQRPWKVAIITRITPVRKERSMCLRWWESRRGLTAEHNIQQEPPVESNSKLCTLSSAQAPPCPGDKIG